MKRERYYIIFGISFLLIILLGCFFYFKMKRLSNYDSKFNIIKIIQTGPQKEVLKSLYLEELLGLSLDKPTNLFEYSEEEFEAMVKVSPLIKEVKVRKIKPNTLYVDYTVRRPIAWFGDFENIAIDDEGYFFPIMPFLSPKRLPEVYLGVFKKNYEISDDENFCNWKTPITSEEWRLALGLMKLLSEEERFFVKKIDTSFAFAKSLGKRQIVLTLETHKKFRDRDGREILCIFPHILRLGLKNYHKQLGNYISLNEEMCRNYAKQISMASFDRDVVTFRPRIIDLRIDQIGFIDLKH